MKNLMFIISTLERCGPVNVLYNLIKYLDKDKYNITILTLSPEPENSRFEDFQGLSVKIITFNLPRNINLIKNVKSLKRVIKEYNPDIIHTHGLRADLISTLIGNQYKKISTSHNYPLFDYPLAYGKLKGNLIGYLHLKIFKKIENVIGCSKTISKQLFLHGIKAISIQNGIDTEKFYSIDENSKKNLRKKLNIPVNKVIYISVGSLIKRKNISTVINGFLYSKPQNSTLLIAGEGPLRSECEKLSKNSKEIIFLGNVDNVSEYLKCSDYMISASTAEGLPMAVLESLATGLPVILSDIPPHSELLEYNKDAGLLFENSYTKLAEKIINITNDRKSYVDMSNAAISIINKYLNARLMAKSYEKIYDTIA